MRLFLMAFANVAGHNHCLATFSSYACVRLKSTAKIGFIKNKFNIVDAVAQQ
jgi:hypothetical protein